MRFSYPEGLEAWGYSRSWHERFEAAAPDGAFPARVIRDHRGYLRVRTIGGELIATTAGRLKHRAESSVELPAVGDVVLQDTETGRTREFTIDEQLRTDFERAASAHRADVARTLRRCDAPLLTLRTDRDWIADVVRFVATRRLALAGRA